MLVYDKADAHAAVFPRARTGGIDPRVDELIDELVARWVELTPDARTTIGRRLLERVDPGAGTLDETAIFERLRSMASAHG